jgi:predicted nucleic acid-binding protein
LVWTATFWFSLLLPNIRPIKKSQAIVEAEIESGADLVFPSLVIAEFLHIATDGRRFSPPLTMPEAVAWIQEFMTNPAVRLLEPTRASLDQTLQWMKQFNLAANASLILILLF